MADNKVIHIVPHSHWDREWYMSFEEHRFRLVSFIDSVIEKMENDPDFKYFHLDGQMILISDYLEVKPYMFERIKKLVNSGRLQVGPWYVLQDEYLVSDEANVRNLLIGLDTCKEMGLKPTMIGYFPDSFGNVAQMPQILKKCGINSAVFGRGVTNISEIVWKSEDGSCVTAAHFAPWYNNANELPVSDEQAKIRNEKLLFEFKRASKCNHCLGMNGCDHQPIQQNLNEAIRAMNKNAPENVEYIFSNLPDYMEKVEECTADYPVIKGELMKQTVGGMSLLVSTASARIYIKQANRKAQNLIERCAEPLSAMAYIKGADYPSDYLNFAWKNLLLNHPHDSICGCSVDEVHEEMMIRYKKTDQISSSISKSALENICKGFKVKDGSGTPVAVFNTSVFENTGLVSVTVDLPDGEPVYDLCLCDADGTVVAQNPDIQTHVFKYFLPDNAFRYTDYVNRYKFTFFADKVPAMGSRIYFAKECSLKRPVMAHTDNSAENELISLKIEDDGSLTVFDKSNNKEYSGLNTYENITDTGDEYFFKAFGKEVTTEKKPARISVKKADIDYVTFEIKQQLIIPEGFDRDANSVTDKNVEFNITTFVTLNAFERGVTVKTVMENRSGFHRVRALFKNGIKTDKVYANGTFDVLARDINDNPDFPTNEQRLQSFVALKDQEDMLLVATRGLHEYEVKRDGSNTLCINLLRSVDQLGDWGYFPTPDAQCLGTNTAEYKIFVGKESDYALCEKSAFHFSADDMPAVQFTAQNGSGNSPAEESLLSVEGSLLWNTAFKKQESGDGLVLRLYNTSDAENKATLKIDGFFKTVREADIKENPCSDNILSGNSVDLNFRPKEIKTLLLD